VLTCEEVIAELANFLDQEISPDDFRQLQIHLSHCSTCRVIYDSTRKTLRIVTESRSFELPEDVSSRMMASIISRITSDAPPKDPTS